MASWQDRLTSNRERLTHIYRRGEMSDVTFKVGRDGKTPKIFRVHKLILSMQSDVFFKMFYGPLPEKDQVEITDIQPAVFEIVMKYIYEESFSVRSMTEAMETYCAAEKYNIVHLRSLCVTYITKNVSPENILLLYAVPNLLEALEVKSKCEEILSQETSFILNSDIFLSSPLALVRNILQLDRLNVGSEAELFQHVVKWAKSPRNVSSATRTLRAEMEPFLPHVRFLAMSAEEFLSGPAKAGILTDTEKASILENLAEPGCGELPPWCNKSVSRTTMRSLNILQNHSCTFLDNVDSKEYYGYDQNVGNDFEYKIFITMIKGTLKFRGMSFYVTAKGSNEPQASLYVISKGNSHLSPSETKRSITSSYDSSKSLMKCTLLRPIVLECHSTPSYCTIIVCLQDSTFKYCSTLVDGSIIKNEQFEFKLHCHSRRKEGHFYEIFYD